MIIAEDRVVSIHYTLTNQEGQTLDSSSGREPLEFTVGSGQIIPGLDKAIPGMAVGDSKTVQIPCEEAYGPHNPEGMQQVPRSAIPDTIPLELGLQLQMQTPQGQTVPVTVVELSDETVTLDANHPLAGQDLTFAIEVVAIG